MTDARKSAFAWHPAAKPLVERLSPDPVTAHPTAPARWARPPSRPIYAVVWQLAFRFDGEVLQVRAIASSVTKNLIPQVDHSAAHARYREAVALRDGGASYGAIAARYGIAEVSARRLLVKARAWLRHAENS